MPAKKKKKTKTNVKKAAKVKIPEIAPVPARYIEAIGRRKTSEARVRIYEAQGSPTSLGSRTPKITVNQKPCDNYFPTYELRHIVQEPISKTNLKKDFSVSVKVEGGGIHSQAEAVRHGLSRALEKQEPELRKVLKPLGFLKRDPRMKERRKFGLKKARKSPQWAKR